MGIKETFPLKKNYLSLIGITTQRNSFLDGHCPLRKTSFGPKPLYLMGNYYQLIDGPLPVVLDLMDNYYQCNYIS